MTDLRPERLGATTAERPRLARVAALVVLLLLLAAVAAAAGGVGSLGRDPVSLDVPQLLVDYAFSVLVVLLVVVAAAVVLALLQVRRAPTPRPITSGRRFIAGLVVLAVAVGIARLVRQPDARPPGEPIVQIPEIQPLPPTEGTNPEPLEDPSFRWEVALVAVAGALVALALVLRRYERGEPDGGPDEAAAAVSAVLDEALDDLRAERDARRAVIAAYARLEATLAYHGLPRRPAEAPLEYLARILLELEVEPEAVLDLTQLFEQAKFSRRDIDAAMKDEAIDALVAVRDDLRAAA